MTTDESIDYYNMCRSEASAMSNEELQRAIDEAYAEQKRLASVKESLHNDD